MQIFGGRNCKIIRFLQKKFLFKISFCGATQKQGKVKNSSFSTENVILNCKWVFELDKGE